MIKLLINSDQGRNSTLKFAPPGFSAAVYSIPPSCIPAIENPATRETTAAGMPTALNEIRADTNGFKNETSFAEKTTLLVRSRPRDSRHILRARQFLLLDLPKETLVELDRTPCSRYRYNAAGRVIRILRLPQK